MPTRITLALIGLFLTLSCTQERKDAPEVLPDATDAAARADAATLDVEAVSTPGKIVLSEFMVSSVGPPEKAHQWVELVNVGGALVRLDGWSLKAEAPDGTATTIALPAAGIEAGQAFVFGANSADPTILLCAGKCILPKEGGFIHLMGPTSEADSVTFGEVEEPGVAHAPAPEVGHSVALLPHCADEGCSTDLVQEKWGSFVWTGHEEAYCFPPDCTEMGRADNVFAGVYDIHGNEGTPGKRNPWVRFLTVAGACGDSNCVEGESCSSCPADCGPCPWCGDGECSGAETCTDCPVDCGGCCGQGGCQEEYGESCDSCPTDCGECSCPNGTCDTGENCGNCPDCACDEPCFFCLDGECQADCECVCSPLGGAECGFYKGCPCGTCGPGEDCVDYHCVPSALCAETCSGCCIGGTCTSGTSDTSCGKNGASCTNCSNSNKICQSQQCVTPQPNCGDGVCNGTDTECSCPGDCGTCSGCCSGSTCDSGTNNSSCGKNGASCTNCSSSNKVCQSQQCITELPVVVNSIGPSSGVYSIGGSLTVTWWCNAALSDTMRVSIKRDSYQGDIEGAGYKILGSSTPNDGSQAFTVPPGITPASDWRVWVRHNASSTSGAAAGAIAIKAAAAECGDGSCNGTETNCTCSQDCGTCWGCCSGSTCNPGTSNSSCGKSGGTCQSCGSGTCQNGQCCMSSCSGKCPGAADGCGGKCSGNSCSGCCSGSTCVSPVSGPSCGKNGSACKPCPAGVPCVNGECVCQPSCSGKCPGAPDGCGYTCVGNSCPGCCDGSACNTGTNPSACGKDGKACQICGAGSQVQDAWKCTAKACECPAFIWVEGDCSGYCTGTDNCLHYSGGSYDCLDNCTDYTKAVFSGEFSDSSAYQSYFDLAKFAITSTQYCTNYYFYVDVTDATNSYEPIPAVKIEPPSGVDVELSIEYHCLGADATISNTVKGTCQVVNYGGDDFVKCTSNVGGAGGNEEVEVEPNCPGLDDGGRMFVTVTRKSGTSCSTVVVRFHN